MAKPIIGDCFIGDFPVSQGFGQGDYSKFKLKGHNGIDFATPHNTSIIAATDGIVKKIAYDPAGYGYFVEIWDDIQLCVTLYAHLDHAIVSVGDRVIRGQLLGYADSTGWSTGHHLHFAFGLTDEKGFRKNQGNGFGGWLDINSAATWNLINPTEPIQKEKMVEVPAKTFENLVKNSGEYDEFVKLGFKTAEDLGKYIDQNAVDRQNATKAIETLNEKIQGMATSIAHDASEDKDLATELLTAQHHEEQLEGLLLDICKAVSCEKTGDLEKVRECILKKLQDVMHPDTEAVKEYEALGETVWKHITNGKKIQSMFEWFRIGIGIIKNKFIRRNI